MNLYSIGLTMDPLKGGLAIHEVDSSTTQDPSLSQLSFQPGLAERMTNSGGGWSVNTRSSNLINGAEAFEGTARGATKTGNECRHGGHVQQENSSSSQQAAALLNRPGYASGKRKGSISKNSITTKMLESDEKKAKCLKKGVAGASASSSKGPVDEVKTSMKEEGSPGSEHSGEMSPRSTLKTSSKSQDEHPKQDYIHVRARRGQATDSHSLAERVRREKISERMKFLQDLVPGCSKITGKAVMLEEIINYVQSLQRQIEFLSMKLAAVDPRLDINLEHLLNKELPQARSPETTLMSPDLVAGYGEYQTQLQIQQQINSCNMDLRSVGTLCDAYLRRSMNIAPMPHTSLAYTESLVDSLTQTLNGVCDTGDLQAIVHMNNSQGRQEVFDQELHGFVPGFAGPGYLTPGHLKVEYS